MNVKMSGGPASLQIKLILLFIALLIASGTLFYTQSLVNNLQVRERQIVELYASSLESVANNSNTDIDFTFQLDIIKKIDFPLILAYTDDSGKAVSISGYRNINFEESKDEKQINDFLLEETAKLKLIHPPINIIIQDVDARQAVFYGDSELVNKLKFYPYLQIVFAIIFILISYISFSYLKKTEQSNIWVGMAKETAHQLGTPISSLMGWLEILKMNYTKPENVLDVAMEMDNDLSRLNKITNRFSKIGSKPELKSTNLSDLLFRVTDYFNRRLPQASKKVELRIIGSDSIIARINLDLFEWVIENLIKNALDAIDNDKFGIIKIEFREVADNIEIEIEDNGKGIDLRRRKDVFRPGYSTKKRGWGLGLSLARRIVEDYHKGKIFVKSSAINEGTIFFISIPK